MKNIAMLNLLNKQIHRCLCLWTHTRPVVHLQCNVKRDMLMLIETSCLFCIILLAAVCLSPVVTVSTL